MCAYASLLASHVLPVPGGPCRIRFFLVPNRSRISSSLGLSKKQPSVMMSSIEYGLSGSGDWSSSFGSLPLDQGQRFLG